MGDSIKKDVLDGSKGQSTEGIFINFKDMPGSNYPSVKVPPSACVADVLSALNMDFSKENYQVFNTGGECPEPLLLNSSVQDISHKELFLIECAEQIYKIDIKVECIKAAVEFMRELLQLRVRLKNDLPVEINFTAESIKKSGNAAFRNIMKAINLLNNNNQDIQAPVVYSRILYSLLFYKFTSTSCSSLLARDFSMLLAFCLGGVSASKVNFLELSLFNLQNIKFFMAGLSKANHFHNDKFSRQIMPKILNMLVQIAVDFNNIQGNDLFENACINFIVDIVNGEGSTFMFSESAAKSLGEFMSVLIDKFNMQPRDEPCMMAPFLRKLSDAVFGVGVCLQSGKTAFIDYFRSEHEANSSVKSYLEVFYAQEIPSSISQHASVGIWNSGPQGTDVVSGTPINIMNKR